MGTSEVNRENREFTIRGIGLDEIIESVSKLFSGISGASKRIKNITRELRDFVKSDPLCIKKNLQINEIVKRSVSLVHNLVSRSTNHFSAHYGKNLSKKKAGAKIQITMPKITNKRAGGKELINYYTQAA